MNNKDTQKFTEDIQRILDKFQFEGETRRKNFFTAYQLLLEHPKGAAL